MTDHSEKIEQVDQKHLLLNQGRVRTSATAHRDERTQYEQDAKETDRPWKRWMHKSPYGDGWRPCDESPGWLRDWQYKRKTLD